MHRIKTPLFILGNPRSGTSLLRLMLTEHKSMIIPPECGFIQWWFDKYQDWSDQLSDIHYERKVLQYVEDLKTSRKIETWDFDFELLTQFLNKKRPSTYSELCLLVIEAYAIQKNKMVRYLGDKNNYYLSYLELIGELFPNAKYISIIRDGRDVACSYLSMKKVHSNSDYKPKLASSIEEIAEEWSSNINRIKLFLDKIKVEDSIWVRYEDLITNTEEELSRITSFLDISFEKQMLDYYKSNNEPNELLAWKKKTQEKPDVKNIGKFRFELTPDEIIEFETIAGPMLKKFKYDMN
ncbi:MAG: sulfotransferase [Balneola sp.]|nr:MAG: sulfotransferase [Balneola sp.]